MRPLSLVAVVLTLLVVSARDLPAQHGTTDLHATAVRLVHYPLGRVSIETVSGEPVGSAGLFSSRLDRLAASSDAVARRVRTFQRERTLGSVLLGVGASVAIGSMIRYAGDDGFGAATGISAAFLTGGAVAMLGATRMDVARRALGEAVRLHNTHRER